MPPRRRATAATRAWRSSSARGGPGIDAVKEVVEARPDLAKAFRDATLKGLVYALDHPAEIADVILAR